MAPNGLYPVVFHYLIKRTQNHVILQTLVIFLIASISIPFTNAQTEETSVFKPINGDKTGGKLVDFATSNNTPTNQRNLPNNSQSPQSQVSQPYFDYLTRNLPNYIGGGTVGATASAAAISNNGLGGGIFAPNYGQFGAIPGTGGNFGIPGAQFGLGGGGNKLPFPPGPAPPFPFPPGQFPAIGGFGVGGGGGFGAGGGGFGIGGGGGGFGVGGGGGGFGVGAGGTGFQIGKPQFPQSPQFPFGPSHNPSGGYFPPGFHNQGYPYTPATNNGIGNLHFGLPRQIRVPGKIEISLIGNNAEITCEFPRFLLLIQNVYWHHKYDDPYGTYYDSNNGFGPRVTVIAVDKWKSKLQIRDYNEDDYGTYRCLTAAVLPEESSSPQVYSDNRSQFLLRSPSTTTENTLSPEFITRLKLPEKPKTRMGKDMKYISGANRVTRKIRFSRSITKSTKMHESTTLRSNTATNRSMGDLKNIGSESIYDPYYLNNNYAQNYVEGQTPRNYLLGNNFNTPSSVGPFQTSTNSPLGFEGHSQLHNSRYNPLGGFGYPNYVQQGSSGFGPYAPYYKPSYGLFTIYQEIKFAPVIRSGSSSPRSV